MKVFTTATVNYECVLSKEDEQKVRNYVKERGLADVEDTNDELYYYKVLCKAIKYLYAKGEINLYKNSRETDFETEDIYDIEDYDED